jgi:hypothetical protein
MEFSLDTSALFSIFIIVLEFKFFLRFESGDLDFNGHHPARLSRLSFFNLHRMFATLHMPSASSIVLSPSQSSFRCIQTWFWCCSISPFSFCQQIVWFCVSAPIWFCVELIICCLVLFFSEFIYFQITRFDTNCSDTTFACAFRIHPSLYSLRSDLSRFAIARPQASPRRRR